MNHRIPYHRMDLKIPYESHGFAGYPKVKRGRGILPTSWNELVAAAITIGRPSLAHVFRYGDPSKYEVEFRRFLTRMAVEQYNSMWLRRTRALIAMDTTEKGMVSYFLGMTLCNLFAVKLLDTGPLIHLDAFPRYLNPELVDLGRSRPDLAGKDIHGDWHAFESKGRSTVPSNGDMKKAVEQANRLISVQGNPCVLHVGSIAYFDSEDDLRLYWRNSTVSSSSLPGPTLSLEGSTKLEKERQCQYGLVKWIASKAESAREIMGIEIEIHKDVQPYIMEGDWARTHGAISDIRKNEDKRSSLEEEGFSFGWLKLSLDESWLRDMPTPWEDE